MAASSSARGDGGDNSGVDMDNTSLSDGGSDGNVLGGNKAGGRDEGEGGGLHCRLGRCDKRVNEVGE